MVQASTGSAGVAGAGQGQSTGGMGCAGLGFWPLGAGTGSKQSKRHRRMGRWL